MATLALILGIGCTTCRSPLQVAEPPGTDPGLVADGQYEAVDLGTLGGASAVPTAINDAGQVAGVSQTAAGVNHAFLWERGVMRDLGAPSDGTSEAHKINRRGQVAGMTTSGGGARVFLWDNGDMRDLGPDNARFVVVRRLCDSGDVVATVYWLDGRISSVVWRAGVMQDLGSLNPAEHETYAYAANDAGLVAGQSNDHPFLWDGTRLRDLGVLGGAGSQGLAEDVNRTGQVVGWSTDSAGLQRGFVWQNGAMQDLGAFPGRITWAVNMNDRGQVVGEYATDFYSDLHAFVWENGGTQELASLGGLRTGVLAITEEGLVAGYSSTAEGKQHTVVWLGGRTLDLGPGMPMSLNEAGDIIGVASNPPAPQRGILWRRMRAPTLQASVP